MKMDTTKSCGVPFFKLCLDHAAGNSQRMMAVGPEWWGGKLEEQQAIASPLFWACLMTSKTENAD